MCPAVAAQLTTVSPTSPAASAAVSAAASPSGSTSVHHRAIAADSVTFTAALRRELNAGALSDAESQHALMCPTALQAAADLLRLRGFRIYTTEGGTGIGSDTRTATGWHSLIATPSAGATPGATGAGGVATYVLIQPNQEAWDAPDMDRHSLLWRRARMTQEFTRVVDEPMGRTTAMLEGLAGQRDPWVAVHLSVLLPAWWSDRLAEGHSPETAQFMLSLLLTDTFAAQVEFTDGPAGALPTMRGFTLTT